MSLFHKSTMSVVNVGLVAVLLLGLSACGNSGASAPPGVPTAQPAMSSSSVPVNTVGTPTDTNTAPSAPTTSLVTTETTQVLRRTNAEAKTELGVTDLGDLAQALLDNGWSMPNSKPAFTLDCNNVIFGGNNKGIGEVFFSENADGTVSGYKHIPNLINEDSEYANSKDAVAKLAVITALQCQT